MNKFFMYPSGSHLNRGCEAIARTTAQLLNSTFDNCEINYAYLKSSDKDAPLILPGINKTKQYGMLDIEPGFIGKMKEKILRRMKYYQYNSKKTLKELSKDSIGLCIGGDNYCYEHITFLLNANEVVRGQGCKTVLWGASVDVNTLTEEGKKDLEKFDLISVRESLSYEGLKEIFGEKKVRQFPDSAFTMMPQKCDVESIPIENAIGINLSPLVSDLSAEKGILENSFRELIEHILNNTSSNIVLVPHVTMRCSDDRVTLLPLYQEFKNTGRVFLLEKNYNAPELKYIISKLGFFIGARTHATIAAYSTKVPTLTIGYSIKSRGIAIDLFGTEKDYVIPVQVIKNSKEIIEVFDKLYANKDLIKQRLSEIMPGYIGRASQAPKALKEIL